jgi:ubiquitin-like protein Pup
MKAPVFLPFNKASTGPVQRLRRNQMPTQEHSRPQRRDDTPDEAPEPTTATPEATARKDALDDDIDSVLDEIDGVLESNAEEFVRGFVQKGGQ